MKKFTFRKEERLNKEKLIKELFEKGSSFYLFPFKVFSRPNPDEKVSTHQVLVSVSKKIFKKAVDRNLIKRRMRESYRLNKNLLPDSPKLLIAYIYNAKEILTFAQIQERLIKTLSVLIMWRRYKWPVLLAMFVVAAFAFRNPAEKYFEVAKSLDIFATLFKEVNTYYVDDVDPEKLVRKGIDAMLQSLDPYTDYISEDEMESFRITTTGQYGGIGALIGIVNKRTVVTHPYKNFPAQRNGIRVGDEIISVNGQSVQGKSTSEISSLLKGQPKTDLEIGVKRYGQSDDIVFKIKREKISVSNVTYYALIQPEIAYIKLDDFTPGASYEVAAALIELKKKGAKSLILDLRDNPGGLLHEAINIVGLFIPKGMEVVSTKGKAAEWNKIYKTLNSPLDTQLPMAILTSEGSASAAEIVAGALQDYDRAVLIGQKTFGKGLVQTTRPLSYNSQLKVTTAKYYIPSGRCIQELDYTHRKADGTVVKVADSLKREYKTKSGRKVYDGGGLDPDIKVENEFLGTVTLAILNSGLVFDYACKYVVENPATPDFRSFKLSDSEYAKFTSWLKENNFTYVTPLEETTNELIQSAKQDRYYEDLETELTHLKSKIESNKTSDLDRFADQIKVYLEEQIAFHYSLSEGQVQVSLNSDKELVEARKVLSDSTSYKKNTRSALMAFILSIETSAGTCSVALYNDALLIGSETVNEPQSHASRLAPLIQTLLGKGGIAAKSLNAVAISAGPGSYTGLRIGTSTAKGICVSLNIPLIAIPALDMLAHEAYARFAPVGLLCPMIDARRMEVYCQIYNTNFEILDPVKATVVDDSTFQELLATGKVFFFGNGAEKCKDVIRHPNAFFLPEILSNAETLGRMAYEKYEVKDFEDLTNFTPFYLKEFVAKKSKSLL